MRYGIRLKWVNKCISETFPQNRFRPHPAASNRAVRTFDSQSRGAPEFKYHPTTNFSQEFNYLGCLLAVERVFHIQVDSFNLLSLIFMWSACEVALPDNCTSTINKIMHFSHFCPTVAFLVILVFGMLKVFVRNSR